MFFQFSLQTYSKNVVLVGHLRQKTLEEIRQLLSQINVLFLPTTIILKVVLVEETQYLAPWPSLRIA